MMRLVLLGVRGGVFMGSRRYRNGCCPKCGKVINPYSYVVVGHWRYCSMECVE